MRNPDWSRDETILLMDLYLSAPRARKTHPEVAALSALLRAAASAADPAVDQTFRNPTGIAMRLRNFGRHDPAAPVGRDSGLRPGGAIDAVIWREFGNDREALAAEVWRVRAAMALGIRLNSGGRSSRGPVPAFGARTGIVDDGPTSVYLLQIEGPLPLLAPDRPPNEEYRLVKIGRTHDLMRRLAELAAGLPPGAAVRHIPIGLRHFAGAEEAHGFERLLLDLCDARGWSLGGEFAYARLATIKSALSADASSLRRDIGEPDHGRRSGS